MSQKVPDGWRMTTLGEHIAKMVGGGTPSKDDARFWNGDIPWASVKDLTGAYLDDTVDRITAEGLASSSSHLIPHGTVILVTRMAVGKAVRFSRDVAINQDLRAIFPNSDLDTDFLHWTLMNQERYLQSVATGTTVKGIRQEVIKALPISLPPLSEQRQIAEVLSSVDEAIAATQAVIDQTRTVKQSVMNRLLTKGIGHTRFKQTEIGEIPEGWDAISLKELITIKHGFAFSGEYFRSDETDVILLTPGNFSVQKTLRFGGKTKYYDGPFDDEYVLRTGDLLVVMTDLTQNMAILGNAVLLNYSVKRILHNQRIGKVIISDHSRLIKEFACIILNSNHVQSHVKRTASGTTVRHTAPSRITGVVCAVPPLSEQVKIAEIAGSFDYQENIASTKLKNLFELKASLMSDLLTGQKRVPLLGGTAAAV